MSKPLAKLDGAFELIRTSVDPGWWAVVLLIAVMLGGFGWLSGQVSRMEAKVDAVSLKVAEMPGLFQRDLQAQTEKLSALIHANRQIVRAVPSAVAVAPTQAGAPAPSSRTSTDLPHIVNNRPGPTAGAASNVNTTAAGPNSTAINATTAGPKQTRAATAGRGSQAGPAASATNPPPRTP